MKGSPEVITVLNEILVERHTFFAQLLLCSITCKKWGYDEQEDLFEFFSKEDFKILKKLASRISFLDGIPFVDKMKESQTDITTVDEMLLFAQDTRLVNIASLSNAIEICTNFKDYGTRRLMEHFLLKEDKRLAKIEAAIIQFGERGKA